MIWIDGRTQDTNSSGSMTCGVGPTGAGCFGFGTWGTESEYEATIWNFDDGAEVGKMSALTSGQATCQPLLFPFRSLRPFRTPPATAWAQLLRYICRVINRETTLSLALFNRRFRACGLIDSNRRWPSVVFQPMH